MCLAVSKRGALELGLGDLPLVLAAAQVAYDDIAAQLKDGEWKHTDGEGADMVDEIEVTWKQERAGAVSGSRSIVGRSLSMSVDHPIVKLLTATTDSANSINPPVSLSLTYDSGMVETWALSEGID